MENIVRIKEMGGAERFMTASALHFVIALDELDNAAGFRRRAAAAEAGSRERASMMTLARQAVEFARVDRGIALTLRERGL